MRDKLFIVFLLISFNCSSQSKNDFGMGLLSLRFNHNIPLYKTYKNSAAIDTIFVSKVKEADSIDVFLNTKVKIYSNFLKVSPFLFFEGQSSDINRRMIGNGLISQGAQLMFRVLDSTDNFYSIKIDENSKDVFYVRKEVPTLLEFISWENYLKSGICCTEPSQKQIPVYIKPNGKIKEVFTNRPFCVNVINIKGSWAKIKVANNLFGWIKWRENDKLIIHPVSFIE